MQPKRTAQPTNTNPFAQGQADARAGRPVTASPYNKTSRNWTRWYCGYTSATPIRNPQSAIRIPAPRLTPLSTAGGNPKP